MADAHKRATHDSFSEGIRGLWNFTVLILRHICMEYHGMYRTEYASGS